MELEVGAVLTGKVTGITKFGAFVTVAPGKSGLVHISEITNAYVNDVHDHLTEGQEVKVKVIGIDENGRINLSIKKAAAPAPAQAQPAAAHFRPNRAQPAEPSSFEDKLKQFMQESDSKISGLRQYSDRRSSRRRGR